MGVWKGKRSVKSAGSVIAGTVTTVEVFTERVLVIIVYSSSWLYSRMTLFIPVQQRDMFSILSLLIEHI